MLPSRAQVFCPWFKSALISELTCCPTTDSVHAITGAAWTGANWESSGCSTTTPAGVLGTFCLQDGTGELRNFKVGAQTQACARRRKVLRRRFCAPTLDWGAAVHLAQHHHDSASISAKQPLPFDPWVTGR